MTGGKNRRGILIDQRKQGVKGTFKVYVLDTLDIDRSLTFDDSDALLRCQWRRQIRQELIGVKNVFANSRDYTITRIPPQCFILRDPPALIWSAGRRRPIWTRWERLWTMIVRTQGEAEETSRAYVVVEKKPSL